MDWDQNEQINLSEEIIRAAVEEINSEYAVITLGSGTFILDETDPNGIRFLTKESFKLKLSNRHVRYEVRKGNGVELKEVKQTDLWLNSEKRRQYNSLEFNPKGDSPDNVYNLWSGLPYQPKKGDTTEYWNFVKEIICDNNDELYTYTRKWMAHGIQKPWEIPKVALVLKGLKGIGKGVFASTYGGLFGRYFISFDSHDRLVGRFNGILKDKVCLFADEATWGGQKKEEGILKALITEDQRQVEEKNKDSFFVKNYTRLIIASNEDWVVPTSLDERRFVYYNVSPKLQQQNDYFKALSHYMNSQPGREALMFDLMEEDISNFNPTNIPKSNKKQGMEMIELSMSPVQRFFLNFLNEPGEFLDEVKGVVMYNMFVEFSKHERWNDVNNSSTFGLRVKKHLPVNPKPTSTGVSYRLPSIHECRRYFEKSLGAEPGTIEWTEVPEKESTKPNLKLITM